MFYLILVLYLLVALALWIGDRKQHYMNKYLHILFLLLWGIFLPILFIAYLIGLFIDKITAFKEW